MNDSQTIEPLMANSSAAARLLGGISKSFFYQLHSTGQLGPMPIAFGRKKLWRVDELRCWVKNGCPNREVWLRQQGVTNDAD